MRATGLLGRAEGGHIGCRPREGFCSRTPLPGRVGTRSSARAQFQVSASSVVCGAQAKDRIRVVGTKELEAAVQARTKPLVVDFFASWCGPCVLQSKELIKVAEELGNGVDIIKIDCDRHPDLSRQLQIKGLPTIIIVPSDSSKPAFRTEGLLPAHKIISIIGAETRRAPLNRKAPARHAHKGVVA